MAQWSCLIGAAVLQLTGLIAAAPYDWPNNSESSQNLSQPLPARIARWSVVADVPVSTNNADWTGYANSSSVDWVIQLPDHWSSEDCRKYGKGPWPGNSEVTWTGNPSEGGVAIVVFRATQWELREFLQGRTGTVQVEENAIATKSDVQPLNRAIWGLDRIDSEDGLDASYDNTDLTGEGVHAYVADTGIRTTHQDFEGRAIATLDCTVDRRGNCIECNRDFNCAEDRNGHGTHCAGTIGGRQFGVAKKTQLHAVKVLGDDGSGNFAAFARAIDFIASKGERPAIISASLGGRGALRFINNAVNAATASGVTVIVAAGNEGSSSVPDACEYTPAGVPSAISVGSIGQPRFNDARSEFSNIGSCVDMFAPGGLIPSCGIQSDTDVSFLSGTSMACPHVAGAAALQLGQNPRRTPGEVKNLLVSKATNNRISDVGRNSPNKLLFTGKFVTGPTPSPTFSTSSFEVIANGTCGDVGLSSIPIQATCEAAVSTLGRILEIASGVGCFVRAEGSSTGRSGKSQELCTSLLPQFQQITSGTCSLLGLFTIRAKSACGDAAKALGVGSNVRETTFEGAPEGCFIFGGTQVLLSVSAANEGNGATVINQVPLTQVCMSLVDRGAVDKADEDEVASSGSPARFRLAGMWSPLKILVNGALCFSFL